MLVDSFGHVSRSELSYAIERDKNIQAVIERCRVGYAKVTRNTNHKIKSLKIAGGSLIDLVLGRYVHNDIDIFIDMKTQNYKSKPDLLNAYSDVATIFFGDNKFNNLSITAQSTNDYKNNMFVFEGVFEGVNCKVQLINYSCIKPFDWICSEIFYDVLSKKLSGHGLDLFMILPTSLDMNMKSMNRLNKYVQRGIPVWKHTPKLLSYIIDIRMQVSLVTNFIEPVSQGLALGMAMNSGYKTEWLQKILPNDIIKARKEYEFKKHLIKYADSKFIQKKPCVRGNHTYLDLVCDFQGYTIKGNRITL